MELITHFIDNEPVESVDGRLVHDVNPFSGHPVGTGRAGTHRRG